MLYKRSSEPNAVVMCKICGGSTKIVGSILHPQPTLVAGQPINLGTTTYYLRKCTRCDFGFKWPELPDEDLARCYSGSAGLNWGIAFYSDAYRSVRRIDKIERELLAYRSGESILDIGCSNGAVLGHFVGTWQKFGLELGEEATAVASEREVKILGKTIEDLKGSGLKFDVVASFDVIEHIQDPLVFFQQCRELLTEGGLIVTLTGDSNSLPWKLLGSKAWYCTMVEHVSFFNHSVMRHVAKKVTCSEVLYLQMSHDRFSIKWAVRDIFAYITYVVLRSFRGFYIPAIQRKINRGAPSWLSSRDHMLSILRAL